MYFINWKINYCIRNLSSIILTSCVSINNVWYSNFNRTCFDKVKKKKISTNNYLITFSDSINIPSLVHVHSWGNKIHHTLRNNGADFDFGIIFAYWGVVGILIKFWSLCQFCNTHISASSVCELHAVTHVKIYISLWWKSLMQPSVMLCPSVQLVVSKGVLDCGPSGEGQAFFLIFAIYVGCDSNCGQINLLMPTDQIWDCHVVQTLAKIDT